MVTMSSKTNICERTCSASSGSVLSSHSRMERSVGRGERLMISTRVSTPPTVVMSWCASSEPIRRPSSSSTRRTISGEVRSIVAIRWATSACCSGAKPESTSADCAAVRWARTSAMICACSSLRKVTSCRTSALRREAKGTSV
jgi:hypothetical protein